NIVTPDGRHGDIRFEPAHASTRAQTTRRHRGGGHRAPPRRAHVDLTRATRTVPDVGNAIVVVHLEVRSARTARRGASVGRRSPGCQAATWGRASGREVGDEA